MILFWTISAACLIAARALWAFHDVFFWDGRTRQWVEKVFRDWHYLKDAWILLFAASVRLVPLTIPCLISWGMIYWASWEFFMHDANKSASYQGNKKHFGGVFYLDRTAALAVMIVFVLIPIGIGRL